MTRVMIVDDERLERVLIRNGVEWGKNGFEIVAEAGSGQSALELFELCHPDIVLTDIYMPFMDGLELAKKLKDKSGNVAIIIITGHRDFDYAKKALKIGVEDFILKPIDTDEVLEVCKKVQEELNNGNKVGEGIRQLLSNINEISIDAADNFLYKIANGLVEEHEAAIRIKKYGLNFLEEHFVCMCCRFSRQFAEYDSVWKALEVILNENITISNAHVIFNMNPNSFVVLLGFSKEQVETLKTDKSGTMIKELVEFHNSVSIRCFDNITIGVSNVKKGVSEIATAYNQAEKSVQASTVLNKGNIIFYATIQEENKSHLPLNFSIEDVDWKRFSFLIRNGLREQSHDFVREYADIYFKSLNMAPSMVSIMSVNLISAGAVVLSEMGKKPNDLYSDNFNLYDSISGIKMVSDMTNTLIDYVNRIINYVNVNRIKKTDSITGSATQYIENNLSSPGLSLNTLAGYLYVNASYLSRTFKQDVGENITEYITKKRIEKSMELLNTTSLKTYEIANKVGIIDPHYFSICFKKYTGQSVKYYRNSI
ncbi:MAG TPA: response regulator [Ruminiclostridium sp.]